MCKEEEEEFGLLWSMHALEINRRQLFSKNIYIRQNNAKLPSQYLFRHAKIS